MKKLSLIFFTVCILIGINSCSHIDKQLNIKQENKLLLIDAKKFLEQYAINIQEEYTNNDNATNHFIKSLEYRDNNYDLAIKEVKKSLEISLQTVGKFSSKTAFFYKVLADIYTDKKDYFSAIKYYEELLIIFKKAKVNTVEVEQIIGYRYSDIAVVFNRKNNYTKAIFFYKKVLKYFNLKKDIEVLTIYENIALLYEKQHNHKKAIVYREKRIKFIIDKFGDKDERLLDEYLILSMTFYKNSDYNKSLEVAKNILEKNKIDKFYQLSLNMIIGKNFNKLKKYDKALEYIDKALNLKDIVTFPKEFTTEKKAEMISSYYIEKSISHYSKKDYKNTIESYEKARNLAFKHIKKIYFFDDDYFSNIANAYLLLGFDYMAKYKYKKALECTNKSVQIFKKIKKETDIHRLEAEYVEILSIYIYGSQQKLNQKSLDTTELMSLLNLYKRLQKALLTEKSILVDKLSYEDSKSYIDLYIKLASSIGDGYSRDTFKMYDLSLDFFNIALEKAIYFKRPMHLDGIYADIGDVYLLQRNKKKAIEFYKKVKPYIKPSSYFPIEKRAYQAKKIKEYSKKSFASALEGDMKKSYEYLDKGVNLNSINQSKDFKSLSTEEKLDYKRMQINPNFRLGLTYAYIKSLKNNPKEANQILHKTVNNWLNEKGSIFYFDNIKSVIYNKTNNIKIKNKIKRLKYLTQKLSSLLLESKKSNWEEYINTKESKEKLNKEVKEIEIFLMKHSSLFKNELELKNIKFTSISKYLQDSELYIDFIREDEFYYLFILNKNNQITFKDIASKSTKFIEKNIKKFQTNSKKMANLLNNKSKTKNQKKILREQLKIESQKILSALYTLLIEPLSKELKNKKSLIISPDGLLNFLPFEALYHNGKYLIEDYDISYISSGREFVRQIRREKAHPKYKMICFGDPDFNTTITASTKGQFGGNQIVEETWKQMQSFSDIGKDEIKTIRSIYGSDARIFEDREASIENLMRVDSSEVLHFSTHGKFLNNSSIQNPMMKAGLAFAGANNRANLNGIATALKLSALDLKDTNLVVLSACESGLGDVQNSEGVMGLPKAFLQAGAREVIMSLWSVSTQKTAELMEEFYKNVQNEDEYAIALRKAKIKMLDKHPYYWSAFVMHGVPNLTQRKNDEK